MDFFRPPQPRESWHIMAYTMLAHSISFHTFRAYIIQISSKFQQNNVELLDVTYLFDTVYYACLVIGAVVLELVSDKFFSIQLIIAGIIIAQFIYFNSNVLLLSQAAFVVVAGLSGTIKIGLIAYGAAEQTENNNKNLLSYFAIIYIAEMIGHFIVLRFVKMNMLIKNMCGTLACSSYIMIVSLLFGIFTWIAFICCNSSVTKIFKRSLSSELTKLVRLLLIFSPLLILWFNYGDGIWRWAAQAKLMNCHFLWYTINFNHMLAVDQLAVILCGMVYLCFTYFKFVVRCPSLTILFGGFLISTALILSSYNYDKLKKYDQPNLPKNTSRIYLGGVCSCNNGGKLHSLKIEMNSNVHTFDQKVNKTFRSFDWILEGDRGCYEIKVKFIMAVGTFNRNFECCLYEKTSYAFAIGCYDLLLRPGWFEFIRILYLFDDTRDVYGRPKICIMNGIKNETSVSYHVKLLSVDKPNARFTTMTDDYFTCRAVQEGQYDLAINFEIVGHRINFRYGGVYLVYVSDLHIYQIMIIRQPLEMPIWYLLKIIYLAAFGKNCIIITGMYMIYTKSSNNVRTIAIGSWWLFISSGNFIYKISASNIAADNLTNFMSTGKLIGEMTVLFVLCYVCLDQLTPTYDSTPTINDLINEEDDEHSLPSEPPLQSKSRQA